MSYFFRIKLGQGPAVFAADAEWEGLLIIFLLSVLSSFFFSLSPGRRLDLTTMVSTGLLARL